MFKYKMFVALLVVVVMLAIVPSVEAGGPLCQNK